MVPDFVTIELLPSSSTFSTGPLAIKVHPIYTHYPAWEIILLVIWQRVEPQWNCHWGNMEFLMLVGEGRFKYSNSEDLEGIGQLGTGTNDKLHLPYLCWHY